MAKGVKIKEPNTLIEAKHRMTREEMVIWLWSLVSAKIYSDKNGKPIPEDRIEEIKRNRETIYAVNWIDLNELAERFPQYFTSKKLYYYKEILEKLKEKVVFEVNLPQYLKVLEEMGFGYLKEKLNIPDKKKTKYYGIATIMAIALTDDGKMQIVYTPYVAPLLVSLKKWFSLYRFDEILGLKSKNSIILYRIAREKIGLKQNPFTLSLAEIKLIFNLKEQAKTWDIRRAILKPAVEEINKKTSLRIKFEPIRKGRGGKIVAYKFKVEELEGELESYFASEKEVLRLIKKLSLTIEGKELSYGRVVAELIEEFGRVNPSVAIWFLLHYPEEAREYALKHINFAEEERAIKFPDRYLVNLIPNPKAELDILLDQRIKDTIGDIVLKDRQVLKEWIKFKLTKHKQTVSENLARIKEKFNIEGRFIDYIKKLYRKGDVAEIRKIFDEVERLEKSKEWWGF